LPHRSVLTLCTILGVLVLFFFSSRRRHTMSKRDWSSDVCSSDLMSEEEIATALEEVTEDEIVDIANLNCPGQIVISGSKEGVDEASELLKEKGAKRVIPLNVSGPFHSRLMQPANEEFAKHLDAVT